MKTRIIKCVTMPMDQESVDRMEKRIVELEHALTIVRSESIARTIRKTLELNKRLVLS